jgi:phosphoribosylformimino-5-aminoimidazole carboxamide ribotide isomerase
VLILPAIDLRGGKCVRLRQGDYAQEMVFGDDPAAMARRWVGEGAAWLHVVDLDGARDGRPVNGAGVQAIVRAAGVPCQVGGGLRTVEHVAEVLGWGAERVVIGTRALQDAGWLERVCERFPGKIVLGIDSKRGWVATSGWLEVSETTALDLAHRLSNLPLAALVYTDISRDGMLGGPNVQALAEMAAAVPLPIIASGGITTPEDIRTLAGLGLAGCIVGRALYEGRLNLRDIIPLVGHQETGVRSQRTEDRGQRTEHKRQPLG